MNFKQVVSVFAVIVALCQLSQGAAVVEKQGYRLLGKLEESGKGVRAAGVFYFASEDAVNHGQAISNCREDFGGQLVTPLNSQQINYIRQALETAGVPDNTHFWTAGKQTAGTWYWSTTGKALTALALNNWNKPGHYDANAYNRCLGIVGQLGSFGLCNTSVSDCNVANRYICEVQA